MKKLIIMIVLLGGVACSEVEQFSPRAALQNQRIASFDAKLRYQTADGTTDLLDGATLTAATTYRIFTDGEAVLWEGERPFKCLFWLDTTYLNKEEKDPYDYGGASGEDVFSPGAYQIKVRGYYGTQEDITYQQEDIVTFTVVASDPDAENPDVLWKADHETGNLLQWDQPFNDPNTNGGGQFNSPGKDEGFWASAASRDEARSGDYSAKLQLFDVQKATDTATPGIRLFRYAETRSQEELYYSVWYYLPERYEVDQWWNVLQFKSSTDDGRNDPFFILNVGNRDNGDMYFYLYNRPQQRSYPQNLRDIPVGRWFQVEVYHRSRGNDTGAITVWQDGVELFDVQDVPTRYPDGDIQWSVNNYTDNIRADTITLYVDDAIISKTRVGVGN